MKRGSLDRYEHDPAVAAQETLEFVDYDMNGLAQPG